MGWNATGVTITKKEAQQIGKRIQAEVLSKMEAGQGILLDLSVASEPDEDKYLYQILTEDPVKFYSASYEWLENFV